MNETTLLFCVDAGADAGLGHLQRCLALADACSGEGVASLFAVPASAADRVRAEGFVAVEAGRPAALATAHQASAVVIDSYKSTADDMRAVRAAGLGLVVIDDLAAGPLPADVLVNGGLAGTELPYAQHAPGARCLLGPEYALLGREFWTCGPRATAPNVRRVLVAAGGGNLAPVFDTMVSAVMDVDSGLAVDLAAGPFMPVAWTPVDSRASRVHVERASRSLYDLMVRADLAVCGAGQTLYGCAAAGTPSVAVQLADNQAANARLLSVAGVTTCAGVLGQVDLRQRVAAAVTALLDSTARSRLAAAGQRLVDGRGALRVAREVAALARARVPARAART